MLNPQFFNFLRHFRLSNQEFKLPDVHLLPGNENR